MNKKHSHFKGKEALSHVIEARQKGKDFMQKEHGLELSGPFFSFLDAAKETAFFFTLLIIIFSQFSHTPSISFFTVFALGYLFFRTGKTAIMGWVRLERLHRIIEEERYEIEHHRPQEKEELTALYQAKGFSGKLLEEVIEILMADDNRLLQVMLEEELGLGLEKIEHPLKQALGAFIGVFISSVLFLLLISFVPLLYSIALTAVIIIICTSIGAYKEKRKTLAAISWNLAVTFLSFAVVFFSCELLKGSF